MENINIELLKSFKWKNSNGCNNFYSYYDRVNDLVYELNNETYNTSVKTIKDKFLWFKKFEVTKTEISKYYLTITLKRTDALILSREINKKLFYDIINHERDHYRKYTNKLIEEINLNAGQE